MVKYIIKGVFMFFIEELSPEKARIVLSDLKRSYSYYYEISFEVYYVW